MSVWLIILLVICALFYLFAFSIEYDDYKEAKIEGRNLYRTWRDVLKLIFAPLYLVLLIIRISFMEIRYYISTIIEHGGFIKYRKWKKQKTIEEEKERAEREAKYQAEKAEYERIKDAYLTGELTRSELPRAEDGETCFEFDPKMGMYVTYYYKVREIVYVESEYNERLNRFFQEHKDLRLFHRYKFVYLPNLCVELGDGELFHYVYPNATPDKGVDLGVDSTYPIQYLVYPEDKSKIKQGMFFFRDGRDNHGAQYIEGDYHPLYEGSDEEIIEQLNKIVKDVHDKHGLNGLPCMLKEPAEGRKKTDDYADEMFYWKTIDPEVAKLMEEVKERLEKLKEYGLAENVLLNLVKEKQKLSKLIITKDMRILLPDYQNMEIKMEPINKAVYFLFLRHSEGIVFKCLPDYRKELAEIYQKIKPLGLNERVIRSIEDVTNPMLNSINEKCARIRGAFIAKFDDSLAQHYYIYGMRGEPKKISLPRDLVVWE